MRVAKWGNSLAVRLPAAVVESLALNEGDEVRIEAAAPGELRVSREPSTEELWARLHALRTRLPADFRFSRNERDEANER